MKDTEILTLAEFAERVNYSERWIRQMCKDGKIAGASKLPTGRKWLINASQVGQFSKRKTKRYAEPHQQSTSQRNLIDNQQDPLIIEAKKDHTRKLARIAKLILQNDVGKVIVVNDTDSNQSNYTIASDKTGYYDLTRDELITRIEVNIDSIVAKFDSSLIFDVMQPHIIAEAKVQNMYYDNFYDFLNRNPGRLVNVLRIIAVRKALQGTCPICQDWY